MQFHHALAFMGGVGGWQWLILLIIALLLFGRRLPEVMRGLGGGVREFRKGIEGADDDAPPAAAKEQGPERVEQQQSAAPPASERKPEPASGASSSDERRDQA